MVAEIQFIVGLPVAVGPMVPECTMLEVKETAHLLVARKQNGERDQSSQIPSTFCCHVYVCVPKCMSVHHMCAEALKASTFLISFGSSIT